MQKRPSKPLQETEHNAAQPQVYTDSFFIMLVINDLMLHYFDF